MKAMREYQKLYIENLKQVHALVDMNGVDLRNPEAFAHQWRKRRQQAYELMRQNTEVLRAELVPVLDNIVSVSQEEVSELVEFARELANEDSQPDLVLGYTIHNALITYARHWEKQALLIQELYYTGLALFYMQSQISSTGKHLYNWKMGMMFGEAASYLKRYDEIDSAKTRGYIHKATADLALSYHYAESQAETVKKAQTIRRSLQILTDPLYHEKTPSLPWDTLIYKGHQERTTLMTQLRKGLDDSSILREVMESAQYVWDRKQEESRKNHTSVAVRSVVEYEMAQYHCGVQSLEQLIRRLEQVYIDRKEDDYSEDGIYTNVVLVGLYTEYLRLDETLVWTKRQLVEHMYRRIKDYVRKAPGGLLNENVTQSLLEIMRTYIEYPDGMSYKDFLLQLIIRRNLDAYVFACEVAEVSAILMRGMLTYKPELLVGVRGCRTKEEVLSRGEELVQFAYDSGMLHDVGMLTFGEIGRYAARSWLDEEYQMHRCHAYGGYQLLNRYESTRIYAQTALGHSVFFNGKGGYPTDYCREKNPDAVVTDLVSVAAYMFRLTSAQFYSGYQPKDIASAVERIRQSGRRFSPDVCELLPLLMQELTDYHKKGTEEAYIEASRRLLQEEENSKSVPEFL